MALNIINRQYDVPSPAAIRDSLLELDDNERRFIITDPETNEHKIISLRRNQEGFMEYDYEEIPE